MQDGPELSLLRSELGRRCEYFDRKLQAEMLNRARVVVARSGYTTLMELAELGKRALFVPTPGQSEQEYLARYHRDRGHVWSTTQRALDLPVDIARAEAASGIPRISPELLSGALSGGCGLRSGARPRRGSKDGTNGRVAVAP